MNKRNLLFLSLVCLILLPLAAQQIPIAPVQADSITHLSTVLTDNWAWLKQRENPRLHQHLRLEDAYTKAMLKPSAKLSKQLQKEFKAWIPDRETSAPYLDNGYYYYSKSYKNKDYSLHYRKKDIPDAREELVMDENKYARGKDYFALGAYSISPDSRFLAYSVDYFGNEIYSLYIKDLGSGRTREIKISGISDFLWQADSRNAIITMQNDRLQSDTCYRLDTHTGAKSLLLSETDPAYDLGMYYNCDKSYIILLSSSKNSSECHYLPKADLLNKPILIASRKEGHQYYPDILEGKLYIQSNLQHPDFSIYTGKLDEPQLTNWQSLVEPSSGNPISTFSLFQNHLVLLRRSNGFLRIQIMSAMDARLLDEIISDSPGSFSFWRNPDPRASSFTYSFENELSPYSIYSYNFATKATARIYQSPLAMSYNPDEYSSKTIMVSSADGTPIPVSMIYAKNLDLSKTNPLWLSAYGAYGDANDPWFSASRLSLLKRGVIFAVAHIRGGGEFGQAWYDAGRLQNKQNTFTDFLACLNHVISSGISSPQQIIIEGGSAGGLLMGAITNLAPEKVAVVIADVPFVDMLSTMLDDSLPLTLQEYEEWGNPNDPQDYSYMKQYSPYDNVQPAKYPKMLISAAWFDTRVGYWEALKWANKLRANNLGQNPILFRMLYHEGHTGSTDRNKSLQSYADTCAFALKAVLP